MFQAIILAHTLALAPSLSAPTFDPTTVEINQGRGSAFEIVALDAAGNVDGTYSVWQDQDTVYVNATWDDGWSDAVIRDGKLISFAMDGVDMATLAERADIIASLPGGGSQPISTTAQCAGYILAGMAYGPSVIGAVYGAFAYCACAEALNDHFDWDLEEC